ncbi:MAG: 30S ribosomal protein S9 [Planctomycetes bacterium]|nr:30S ribosomal protein S9 [Planctomycetota bacterium]
MSEKVIWATGRRKTSVAQIRIIPGKGEITVNRMKLDEYFPLEQHRKNLLIPIETAKKENQYDLFIKVDGGGKVSQVGAIRHGIARALSKVDPAVIPSLKEKYLLTRDPRMKERKKYGKLGARKGQQYSKR